MVSMFCWVARFVMVACFFLTGCATSKQKDLESDISEKSAVVGFIKVEPSGPYFRKHQTEAAVRFIDVMNSRSGERTRVPIEANARKFVTKLEPGHYKLSRIQIGEGPFRSESQVNMSFDVPVEKTVYLGIWQLRVDPPKTVRMLQWDILAEASDWDLLVDLYPDLRGKPVVVSLPQPATTRVRLFAVAPSQPRAKYFYRR